MADWFDLSDGEAEILLSEELLWRQMTRTIWDEEKRQPGLSAFGPSNADHKTPSFSREMMVTAQESRNWHQQNANSPSLAVWAITTLDLDDVDLRAVDDSGAPIDDDHPRAPGHAYLDYRHTTKREERNIRAVLLRKALGRSEESTIDIGFVPLHERAASSA